MKKIKSLIQSEIKKFSEMDKKTKWDYFTSYYLKKTLALVFILVCLVWMSIDMFFARINVVYSGAILGCTVSDEGKEFLTTDFLKVIKSDAKKKDQVVISDDLYMSFMEEEQYNAQTADSALFTMLAAGDFNYLIMDETLLENYLSMDACYDLSDIVSKLGIDTSRCYEDENKEILAISISPKEQAKIGVEGMSGGNIYISFVKTKISEESDEIFLRYLLK